MKPWLKLGSVAITLALLAACSSGIQQPDLELGDETPELSTQGTSTSHVVPDSASDAEEVNGSTYTTSPVLELGYKTDGTPQTTGIRFLGVAVPKGARITGAYLQFTAVTDKSEATDLTIAGQDVASGGPFSATANNITSRTKTSARSSWQPGVWVDGQQYNSSSVASIVQEIVNRSDWQQGAAMVFIISGTGTRKAVSYDSSSTLAPKLYVTYEPPTTTAQTCLSTTSWPLVTLTGTYDRTDPDDGRVTVGDKSSGVAVDAKDALFYPGVDTRRTDGRPSVPFASVRNNGLCLSGGVYRPQYIREWENGAQVRYQDDAEWAPFFHWNSAIRISDTPDATVDGITVLLAGDGVSVSRAKNIDTQSRWTVRNSYFQHTGDDAISNDFLDDGLIDNVLVDWTYTGISCRVGSEQSRVDGGSNDWSPAAMTIQNSVIAMKPQEGTYEETKWREHSGEAPYSGPNQVNHARLFKWNAKTSSFTPRVGCKLTLKNNVFLISTSAAGTINPEDQNMDGVNDGLYDAFNEAGCSNNTFVYIGNNDGYLADLREIASKLPAGCMKVEQSKSVWTSARSAWFDRMAARGYSQFAQYRTQEPPVLTAR